ncbi:ABC transporter ATP-binding protein [Methanocella conradii]|uniref:ABC transporter ATP-binding protein n=1 Tax=Methanocella conradii TaxID=1175444 RepID=UPI00157DBCFF|nr:ABC transporter ATP-binding protein [Methanocella conradii]
MIIAENLTKIYGGIKVVDSVSFAVDKGDIFGFIGPNGAGKTTTMGMMVGMIEPTGGRCYIDGIDVTRYPILAKKRIGYLPESIGFYTNLTGRQNLKFFSKFYGMEGAKANTRIASLLDYVGLGQNDKPVEQYSKGMSQRLGIAHALLNDPDVLFLDEPTNGLDPQGIIQLRNILKELAGKGKTIIFSSHIIGEISHICNKIGIISRGRMIAHGTLDEVKKQMSEEDILTIFVRVNGPMPELSNSNIIQVKYSDRSAVIRSRSDIREELSIELSQKNLHVCDLRIEEKSLEDIFIKTIYNGG